MQDGQLSNTLFGEQLNQSDWGKFAPGTGTLNPQGPAPKTNTKIDYDQLEQSLLAQGDAVNKSAKQIESPYKEEQISPLSLDLTGRFKRQLPGADNEDLWGQSQSNWDKMFNGITKGLALAGTTFLQGTLGLAYGLKQVVTGHGLNSLYNNDLSNSFQNFNNSLENTLPNYYTARERAADWLEPSNVFTINFLFDKLIKNFGFSLGAIYSGAAISKILGLIPEIFGISKAKGLSVLANSIEKELTPLPPLVRPAAVTNAILKASKVTNIINTIISPAEKFLISSLGAVTEGGIEALQGLNDWRNKKIQEYKDANGVSPQGEDLNKINNMAEDLGNARFGMNLALLTATNYVQLPKILSSSYKESKIIANGIERSINPITRKLETGLYESALPSTTLGKLAFRAKNIASLFFSPVEAFEEGAQNTIQQGVEDYYNKAYKGEGKDWLNSISEGARQTLHDKSGLEQILIGGLSGGLQQAGFVGTYQNEKGKTRLGFGKSGEIGERGVTGYGGERAKHTADFLAVLNKSKGTQSPDGWMQAMAMSAARGINLQLEGQQYIKQGDLLEAKDNEFDYQHNYLTPRIQYGRFDLVTSDINNYRQLAASPEGWLKLKEMGIANSGDTRESFLARLGQFEENAKNVNSLYQSLNVRYGGVLNKDKTPKYNAEALEKMTYAASKVANYDTRIPQVNASLASAGISTQPIIDSVIASNRVPEGATKEALDQIEGLKKLTDDGRNQLKSDLRDVIEMSLRRKNFLKAYDQLKEDPEKYTPVEEPGVNTSTTINGKNVEIGKEYSLAQPLFREGNKLSISPTLTILSSTLKGELEVKTPTGEITYRKPKDLSYDLLDSDITDEKYNEIAEKAVDSVIGKEEGRDTLDKKLSFINSQNDKELTDEVEDAITKATKTYMEFVVKAREAKDKLAKDAALKKSLEAAQDALDRLSGLETGDETTDTDEKNASFSPNKPLPAFRSSDAANSTNNLPDGEDKSQQLRRQSFLSILPSLSKQNAANIRVLAITKNNEATYGLSGLIAYVKDQIKNSNLDDETKSIYIDEKGEFRPEQEPIIKLYVTKDGAKLHLIGADGKALSPLEGSVLEELKSQGIFSTFHSVIDGVYKMGPRANQPNFSGPYTAEDVEKINKEHQAWRASILDGTTSPEYEIDQISRGVILTDGNNKPLTETVLASDEDLKNKEGLIVIPTIENQISHGGVSFNYTPGFPVFQNGPNISFLNSRTLTPKEAEDVFHLLRRRIETAGTPESARIESYLSSILYLRSPKAGEAASNSQIFHASTEDGYKYFLGNSKPIDFTTAAFDQNKDAITSFFENYHVRINARILKENSPLGYETPSLNEDGSIKEWIKHPSYQYYLLSSKDNSNPFLQTKARKSVSSGDPSIVSRYTTLKGNSFEFTPKVKEEKKAEQPQARAEKVDEERKDAVTAAATASNSTWEIAYSERRNKWIGEYVDEEGKSGAVGGKTEEDVKEQLKALGIIKEEKPEAKEDSVEDKIKEKKDNPSSLDADAFSFVDEAVKYSPIDVEKELAYAREKTPFETTSLKNVIKTSQGIFAWGEFKGMLISVYEKAQAGTGYHETFEGVWKVFTTPQQKAAILKEFQRRPGTFQFFDGKEYSAIPHSEATEFQAKETLANEFAQYVLTKEEPKGPLLVRWFKQLLNLLKGIFSGKIDSLFSKIDAGHYKSASPIYTDGVSEYSFAQLPYTDQYETVQGVALALIQELINPENKNSISLTEFEESTNVSVKEYYDEVYKKLAQIYENDIYTDALGINTNIPLVESFRNYWENIKQDWDEIKKKTDEYLYSLGIVQGYQDEKGNISRLERDDYSNRDYVDDRKYFMNDAKQTASRSIKLLFATIPEIKKRRADGSLMEIRSRSTLMMRPVNYSKTFNLVMSHLLKYNTASEKEEALKTLALTNLDAAYLYNTLNASHPGSILQDEQLKIRFYQAMSKQQPTPWKQRNFSNGTSATTTANLESSTKAIVQRWIDNMKIEASKGNNPLYGVTSNGELAINPGRLSHVIKTPEDKTKFLSQLNITFTPEMMASLSTEKVNNRESELETFNKAVARLSYHLKQRTAYILDDAKSFEAVKTLEVIAEASITAGAEFETTFLGIEGTQTATRISANAISKITNDLNNSRTKSSLLETQPQLSDVKDSWYLNYILYNSVGGRTGFNIDIGYIQGTFDSNNKPIPGARLSMPQRLGQEINQNLNGRYYILIPADAKTQWLASLKNFITYANIASATDWKKTVNEQFLQYYHSEQEYYNHLKNTLSEKELNSRMGALKEISKNYTLSDEEFIKANTDFINSQVRAQEQFLKEYKVITQAKGADSFKWNALDGEWAKSNGLNARALKQASILNILTARTINLYINNIELHKLYFGQTLAYKDAKRWKLFQSPRESSIFGVPALNTILNESLNTVSGHTLPNALTGQWKFSDYINTVMMKDVIMENPALSKLSPLYQKINSTDAQAWGHLVAMREARIKGGTWNYKRDEPQFQYSQALDRKYMLEDGVLQSKDSSKDNYYPAFLRNHDEAIIENGNPYYKKDGGTYFYVIKPILSSHVQMPDGRWSPVVDKYSIAYFSYAAIRSTNFRDHYVKMLRQGIGYIIAESGRKVGKTTPNTFYTPDGATNTAPYEGVTPVPFSAWGVQTDTSNKKETTTRGSQLSVHATANLYNNGVPITEEAGRLAQHNLALLNEQTEIGYHSLMKKLGAEKDVNGQYRINSKTKIVNLIKDELLRREVADSIKRLLSTKEGNPDELTIPFEALPNYIQIKQIIYSHVDKSIVRPNMNGSLSVQVSGATMEEYGVKKHVINGKDVYTSSSLHFYTPAIGDKKAEPWIEVMLPALAAQKLRRAGFKWNSPEELYDLFKSSPDAEQLLSGVGFRIPTQELNSIENIRIKGFLPEEFGSTVVVPEEITTKAGSDFDIDKLNLYLQNIYIDNEKKLRIVPYFGIGEQAKAELNKWISKDVSKDFLLNIAKSDPDAIDNLEYDTEEEIASLNKGEADSDIDILYKQSIENEYFKNISQILSLPENFERLVTPNTTNTYTDPKTGILAQLVELSETFDSNLNQTIVSPMWSLQTRHNLESIKGLAGIAMVAQTAIVKRQKSEIALNPEKMQLLPSRTKEMVFRKGPNPLIPHTSIGKMASVSSIKDVEGFYITDNNSQIANGIVDVANSPFLAQMNYNRRTAPVWHTMIAFGMPNSEKHPIIALFMNQPIVKEYIKYMEINNRGGNIVDANGKGNAYDVIRKQFKQKLSPPKVREFPKTLSALTEMLKDGIKSYYGNGTLTLEQRGQQLLILDELMKYGVYSNQLNDFRQGTDYDTSRMRDAYSMYFKDYTYNNNIARNIFSDVSTYISNTHAGPQRTALNDVNQTLADVFITQNPIVQTALTPTLSRIASRWMSTEDKNTLARKLEESLLNYLIQTKTDNSSSLIHSMLVDSKTALVNEIKAFRKSPNTPDKIQGNLILNRLAPSIGGRKPISTKNVTLAIKPRDVFSKNSNNAAFQELLDNPATASLALKLVQASFLQNGVSSSRISFKDAIPAKAYADVVNQIMPYIQDEAVLQKFMDTASFGKNNWNDDTLVPTVYDDDDPSNAAVKYPLNELFIPLDNYISSLKLQGIIPSDSPTPHTIWLDGAPSYSQFVTHVDTIVPREGSEDEPIITKRYFQRVENHENQGWSIQGDIGEPWKTLFIQVSALGDSFRAQEHYETLHSSVLDNGYSNPAVQIPIQEFYAYLESGEWKNSPQPESEELPKVVTETPEKALPLQENKESEKKEESKTTETKIPEIGKPNIIQKVLENASQQYLKEWLEKNPRYYIPIPKSEWGKDDLDEYYKKKGTLITMDNIEEAIKQNEALGDQITDDSNPNKGSVADLIDPMNDFIELPISSSTSSEFEGFKNILKAYNDPREEQDYKDALKAFGQKYGLGKLLGGEDAYNPNQLSLFPEEGTEGIC
jgi:hypothetical protein